MISREPALDSPLLGHAAEIPERHSLDATRACLKAVGELDTKRASILLDPVLRVFARARYLQERAWLEEIGATQICIEEAEAAVGLAILLLREVGADEARVREEIAKLHDALSIQRRP